MEQRALATFVALVESQLATEPCVIVRSNAAVETSMNGLIYASLSNSERFFNLQPIKVTVPVSRQDNDHYHHDGEEWVYVLSGKLTLSLAGKTYDLKPGDAAHFDSRLPHRLMASGKRDAQVLLVASPMSNPGQVRLPLISQYRAIPMPNLLTFQPTVEPAATPRQMETTPKSNRKFKTLRR